MKRLFALIIVALLVFSFCGCNNSEKTGTTDSSASSEIKWGTLADNDIVGAWKLSDGDHSEYYIFTQDGKVRVASGSTYIESDIRYGKDLNGIRSAYSQGQSLYGQWTYVIDDSGKLTITYPADDNGDISKYELVRADYTPVKLIADEELKIVDELVGFWYNEEYCDSYEFSKDGYVKYILDDKYDDNFDVFIYKAVVDYTYSADSDTVHLTFIKPDLSTDTIDMSYTIDGDTLTIDGNEYFRTDKSALQ